MSVSPSPWWAGVRGLCPRCAKASLFNGFLTIREACPSCGLDLSAQDSGDGPVAFIVLIAGFVTVIAALLVEVRHGWPVWLHMLVWLPLTLGLCLVMMRPFKGVLIALQYRHRRHEFDTGD